MEFFLFFNKVTDLDLQHFTEKRVSLQIYSCELSDASKNIFLQSAYGRLLLYINGISNFI